MRLGSAYGGWWVPQTALRPGAVAYCGGAGEDITFDAALIDMGLTVRTFDPTPRAVEHVRTHGPASPRFQFFPVGWWDEVETIRFYSPADPSHVSHSAVNLQKTKDFFEAKVSPIWKLAADLGDANIDILKMDIEGAEYRVIDSLLTRGPLPEVLCIEFDQPQPLRGLLRTVRRLTRKDYSLLHIDGWNYTFVRASGDRR
ncbi:MULTISPECIES: FkbM family methyltransferase [unclassified Blastococcus]